MSVRLMLKNVRLAFPVLNTPEKFQGQGKPRYSATALVLPGSDNDKAIEAALLEVAKEAWPKTDPKVAVAAIKASGKCQYKDGNGKPDYDGFPGNMFLSAHAQENAPPRLLDGNKQELPRNTGVIYAGCYVNMSVELWALDKSKGYGNQLNASVRGIQYAGKGDSFGAGRPADADEFDVVEGLDADNSDFDGVPSAEDMA